MALVIESWKTPDALGTGETRRISVAHYFESWGDLVPDPELEMNDFGYPVALNQQGHETRIIWRDQESGKVLVRPGAKKSVESFCRMWASNIRAQRFVQAAKAQAKAAKLAAQAEQANA
jgi:hypothetical protein